MTESRKPTWKRSIYFFLFGIALSEFGYQWIWLDIQSRIHPGAIFYLPLFWKPVLLFLLMTFGIIFNQIFTEASSLYSSGVKTVKPREFLKNITYSPRIWIALSVSPFVFYSTYFSVKELPDTFAAMFLAFQNGFFWQAIFTGFQKERVIKVNGG